ncbi:MAG: TonB-dependent receptor, partial [Marinilabiliales bacterium]
QNIVFRFSTGLYYQPPFYREMRNMDGTLNPDIKSQKSIHFILGGDYRFQAWNRPFIFTTELYYKYLDDLVPYVVDNVRIKYYADQLAKGYATGVDFKVYGEFVKGVDSWISLSLLKTQEDIYGDYYYNYFDEDGELITSGINYAGASTDSVRVEPGYLDRPGDQRINFSIFFQDYIPGLPYVKMHLRLMYGTGLPFGPPQSERYQQTRRMPDYRRVDIGFAYDIISERTQMKPCSFLNNIKGMTVSLEVFNLLQIYNTISYVWIKDINNTQYAVPNYLTPRLINLKLTASF